MHKIKKQWLGSAVLSLLLIGCGEGSDTADKGLEVDNQVVVNTEFAATYLQSIGTEAAQAPAPVTYSQVPVVKSVNTDLRYSGQMKVTNILNGEEQQFDWPVTQKADGTVVSHRALTLKPGDYDFILILSRNERQYVAKALGQDIVDGETPEIDFVLEPNLGKTIMDFDEVQYVSTLKFELLPEEIAGLSQPQFGLSINGKAEQVFSINKETGVAQILLNVDPGEYQLSMRLYDGDLMVGKNDDHDTTVNLVEGEDAKMDLIPLQADVNLNLTPLKDQGTFTFTVPAEVVQEVGSAQELALIVRLAGDNVLAQEKVLTVRDENGVYKASELFETGGQDKVTAYLAFHKVSEASEQFNSTPFASCNTSINVELNQTLGCKLELKRESMVTGRVLGTLMLNVFDQNLQPAIGVKVYVGDKLVGLTGEQYSTGSIKTHLVAGEYEIKAEEGTQAVTDSIVMEPLVVKNKVLYLRKRVDLGDGYFVQHQYINFESGEDKYSDSSVLVDINGDGHLDLIASRRRNSVLIYLNDGHGEFNLSSYSFGDNRYTTSISAADLNGNGHQDIVRTTTDGDQIFFNNGHGDLIDSEQLLGRGDSKSIAIGDLNGNGHLDIVVAQGGKAPLIYLNDGKGNFSDHGEYLSEHRGSSYPNVALADVNGNNYLDIISAGGDNKNMIYLNDGKGNFTDSGQRFGVSNSEQRYNVAAGDINGNGKPDLLITNMDFRGVEKNQLFINDGTGQFETSDVDMGINGQAAAFADVNSNGHLDVVIAGSYVESAKLYINDGNGDFTLSSINQFGTNHHTPLFGDIDDDGDIDLISAYSTGSKVYFNQPAP